MLNAAWPRIIVMCLATALHVFLSRPVGGRTSGSTDFPGWPRAMLPFGCEEVTLAGQVHAWVGSEGGRVGAFVDGDATWLVRWLPQAQRSAHPAHECFLASGYQLKESRLVRDSHGVAWSEFVARRGREVWRVRQRWVALDGEGWTDVSAWYWSVRAEPRAAWTIIVVCPVNT